MGRYNPVSKVTDTRLVKHAPTPYKLGYLFSVVGKTQTLIVKINRFRYYQLYEKRMFIVMNKSEQKEHSPCAENLPLKVNGNE